MDNVVLWGCNQGSAKLFNCFDPGMNKEKVPFRMPANALSPDTVARRILEAHSQGHKGILDLSE